MFVLFIIPDYPPLPHRSVPPPIYEGIFTATKSIGLPYKIISYPLRFFIFVVDPLV